MTKVIVKDMVQYSGDPPVEIKPVVDLESHGFYNRIVFLHEHVGTHIDAPAHLIKGGLTVERIPVDRLVGPAVALDARDVAFVDRPFVERKLDYLGIYTRRGWHLVLVMKNNSIVSEDVAKMLVETGAYSFGVTTPSPDKSPYNVHRILLENNIVIVENLEVPQFLYDKAFIIIIAPLPLAEGSGAPARVYALLTTFDPF